MPGDFSNVGFCQGCPGCIYAQDVIGPRRNHSEACQDRIERELNKTEFGKDRLGRAKDRLDHKLAEIMEEVADAPGHPKDIVNEEQPTQGEVPTASTYMEDETLL